MKTPQGRTALSAASPCWSTTVALKRGAGLSAAAAPLGEAGEKALAPAPASSSRRPPGCRSAKASAAPPAVVFWVVAAVLLPRPPAGGGARQRRSLARRPQGVHLPHHLRREPPKGSRRGRRRVPCAFVAAHGWTGCVVL